MCFATLAAVTGITGAGPLTFGTVFSAVGTDIATLGALAKGQQSAATAQFNAGQAENQAATDLQLTAIKDQRLREKFRQQIAQQRAELAGRGVSLDSPTALLLGRAAAKEMAFASRSVRTTGDARHAELTAEARKFRAQGRLALLTGTLSAAGGLLTKAPDLFPGLADTRVLA